MVKKIVQKSIIAIGVLSLLSQVARADERKLLASVGTDIRSGYFPNGFSFDKSPTLIIDSNLNRSPFSIFGLGAFSRDNNLILAGVGPDVSVEVGAGFSGSAGARWFALPSGPLNPGYDAHGNISWSGILDARLDALHDFGSGNGNYVGTTIGRGYDLSKEVNLRGNIHLGYNNNYFTKNTGFSHAEVGLRAAIRLGKLALEPHIAFSKGLREDFENNLYGGLRASLDLY